MKRINVCVCVLGLGLAGMASAQPPSSDQQQQPTDQQQGAQDQSGMKGGSESMLQAQKTSASATVMKVDKANRQLTLKTDDGKTMTVSVPAGVQRLNEIKVGDHINVDYYEAVALSLNKPGAAKGGEETRVMRGAGKLPNGMIAKKVSGTVTVVNVDTSNNMLTVRRPNGDMETIHVTDPQLQSQLASIKEGDKIHATYTQAAVVTVTREGGGSAGTSPSGGENKPGENQSGGAGSSDRGM